MNEKDELRERLLRGGMKERSYAEKKRLREQARRRKSERRKPERDRWDWKTGDAEGDDPVDSCARRGTKPDASARANARGSSSTGAAEGGGELERGLVIALSPGRALVRFARAEKQESDDGDVPVGSRGGEVDIDVPLAPALRAVQQTAIAVGDDVLVERRAFVRSVEVRRTWLARPDPGSERRERVIAANVDQALIVAAIAEPEFKAGLVDRVLLALARGGVRPCLVVTKCDLATPELERELDAAVGPWRDAALEIVRVSARNGAGLAELRRVLEGRRSVLVGHSGVGKSSLLNALAPGLGLATGAVREHDGKGRHTTTRAALVSPWPGVELIDTPGVRQFGLWSLDRSALREHFQDLAPHAAACRFTDCSHRVEPDCGVRRAVEEGRLARTRLALYERLWLELGR